MWHRRVLYGLCKGHTKAECRRTNRKCIRQEEEHTWLKEKQTQRSDAEKVGSIRDFQPMWHSQGTGSEAGRQGLPAKGLGHHWLSVHSIIVSFVIVLGSKQRIWSKACHAHMCSFERSLWQSWEGRTNKRPEMGRPERSLHNCARKQWWKLTLRW